MRGGEKTESTPRSIKMSNRRLFFSYAHLYRGLAKEILNDLSRVTRTDVEEDWFFFEDGPVAMGECLDSAITKSIDNADAVVVLLTHEYLQSNNCMAEMHRALSKERKLLVLVLGPKKLVDDLNKKTYNIFGARQYFNVAEKGLVSGIATVASQVHCLSAQHMPVKIEESATSTLETA